MTWPKHPSPNGFPNVRLERQRHKSISVQLLGNEEQSASSSKCFCCVSFFVFTHRDLPNSHFGSAGNSNSKTFASIGPSLDDKRAILTNGALEFMEELDSKDTCLSRTSEVLLPPVSLASIQHFTTRNWMKRFHLESIFVSFRKLQSRRTKYKSTNSICTFYQFCSTLQQAEGRIWGKSLICKHLTNLSKLKIHNWKPAMIRFTAVNLSLPLWSLWESL